ncbi:RNA polymerase primary sigma factor [Lachnospiraceae bacterium C7]|nr:RNA polymerase primary sigma factor [Lachnospiraceae bacterium C7]
MEIGRIQEMVKPYLKENKLEKKDFECIFSFLRVNEKQQVNKILQSVNITVVDHSNKEVDSINRNINKEEFLIDSDKKGNNEIQLDYSDNYWNMEFSLNDDFFRDDINEDKSQVKIKEKTNIGYSNRALCARIQSGDEQAKQDLCIQNERLVRKFAYMDWKRFKTQIELDDAIQAGMLGLIKAAERFDFSYNTEFSTYAIWWIRQRVIREIYDTGFVIRLPVHMMEKIIKIEIKMSNVIIEMENKHISYTESELMQEVANQLDVSVEEIEQCLLLRKNYLNITSTNVKIGDDFENEIEEFLPDTKEKSVEDKAIDNSMHNDIIKALNSLTSIDERAKNILIMRFGLFGTNPHTLEEIGNYYGVTRERIRQIEKRALQKLKLSKVTKQLKEYL